MSYLQFCHGVEDHAADVEVESHADGVGGDEHLARVVGVVELGRHAQLGARRQAAVDHGAVHAHPLQAAGDGVDVLRGGSKAFNMLSPNITYLIVRLTCLLKQTMQSPG